jgi:hypothetical protein
LDSKPDFDNEFLKIIQLTSQKNKLMLVYSTKSDDERFDEIKTVILNRKFLDGLEHFAMKPALAKK